MAVDCKTVDWQSKNYSQTPKMFKLDMPILFFNMQIDSNRFKIPGLNRGRLTLFDYNLGEIYRWVATSSYDGKQNVSDWERAGGLHPPNHDLRGGDWYYLKTNLIVQRGQPVQEGYLPIYKGSNTWKLNNGVTRSEVMFHEDENADTNPGSYGCVVMLKAEWESFKNVFRETCGHLDTVRYGVTYSY